MVTVQFNLRGMSCLGCAQSIERRMQVTPGVQSASVDLEAAMAVVTYDEAVTDADTLEKVIEALGFDVVHATGRS